MGFLLEFFFGPCMNHSAVDERQYHQYETPPSSRHQQQQRSREQPQSQQHLGVTYSSNGSYQGSYRSSSGHRPKPTASSSSKRMLSIPENEEAANNMNNNGNLRRSASGNGHTLLNLNHKLSSKNNNNNPSSLSGNTRQSKQSRDPSEISSLSDTFNNKRRSRTRRDDASVISQSLFETYQGYMGSEPDLDLDEQSAIRRSLKDSVPRVVKKKKKRPSPPPQPSQQPPNNGRSPLGNHISQTSNSKHRNSSDASQKTDLESWIEHGGATTSSSRKSTGTSLDVDNVTTISKASKNPYSVLGISHGASPKEIYSSYKRRLKETSQQHQQYDGGSERAFADVGNAYRRIYADIKRQEARRERKRVIEAQPQLQSQSQLQLQSSPQASSRSKKSRKSKRGRRRQQQQQQLQQSSESDEESDAKSRREGIESRLKDHSQLVHQLFANDNAGDTRRSNNSNKRLTSGSSVTSKGQVMTLQNSVHSQSQSLSEMNLVPIEAGAANINERNETIQNSCFYLSLASSYLSGVGAFTNDPTAMYYLNTLRESTTATPSKNSSNGQNSVATVEMEIATLAPKEKQLTMNLALQLKRAIEAAVLLVHPDWAKSGMVGEEVQAFSDFLVYALDSDSVLGHWAIAVFDEASGFVDVYRGRHYGKVYPPTKVRSSGRSSGHRDGRTREGGGGGSSSVKWRYKDCDEKTKRANTLTLRYIPGHYQPLLPELTKMYNERKRDQSRGRATSRYKRPMLEEILAVLERWNVLHVVTDGRA